MKVYIFPLSLLCLIVFASISNGHEIQLKNGRTIQTERYWEDENFLYYEKFCGVIKIPKTNLLKIDSTIEMNIEEVHASDVVIANINSTKELRVIEEQCKISCENEEYEKCAYQCLENTEQVKKCKTKCRLKAKNCKLVCEDVFMKNNLAFLKHEYENSVKPIGQIYSSSGLPRSHFIEFDKKK